MAMQRKEALVFNERLLCVPCTSSCVLLVCFGLGSLVLIDNCSLGSRLPPPLLLLVLLSS